MRTSRNLNIALLLLVVFTVSFGCQKIDDTKNLIAQKLHNFSSSTLPPTPTPVPIVGFADLHTHHPSFASWFGGGWIHGDFQGPESTALSECDGGTDHTQLLFGKLPMQNCSSTFLTKPILAAVDVLLPRMMQKATEAGDIGPHTTRKKGYPTYEGWPRWDGIGHQAVWEGWLQEAHTNGLQLFVSAATDFKPLCDVVVPGNKKTGCNEMQNVETQINAAIGFAASHSSWVAIAHTPEEARSIIASGKLAMILKIETTDLFGQNPNYLDELNHFYNLGVRTIQLGHLMDSRFAGIAPIQPTFDVLQYIQPVSGPICRTAPVCTFLGVNTPNGRISLVPGLGFDFDSQCYNQKGLTSDGEILLDAMMNKNMLIDIAHLSQAAINGVYARTSANNNYPIYMSHADFRPLRLPGERTERAIDVPIAQMIGDSGGMVGLLPDSSEVRSYGSSGVPNRCHGSLRSFAQQYKMGTNEFHLNIAFGTDLNCFTAHSRPRFGNIGACSAAKLRDERICQRKYENEQLGKTNSDLDEKGLAHVGLEDNIVQQLQIWGVDTTNLNQSAENFIRMWERSYNRSAWPVSFPNLDEGTVNASTWFVTEKVRSNAMRNSISNCQGLGFTTEHCKMECSDDTKVKGCRQDCREEKKTCKSVCKVTKGECKDTCKDTKQTCIDGCSSHSCRKACRQAKRACKQECRADKKECKDECKAGKRVCKKDCKRSLVEFCEVNCHDGMDTCACPNFFTAIGY